MGTDHVLIQYISNACYLTKNRFNLRRLNQIIVETAVFNMVMVILIASIGNLSHQSWVNTRGH